MLLQRRGECRGRIEPAERGAGGFGYDALFVPDGSELQQSGLPADLADRTYAELPAEAKNRLSHRGRALRALIPSLATLAAGLPLLAD
jgi:XTP/dITP diphosphohydrolase